VEKYAETGEGYMHISVHVTGTLNLKTIWKTLRFSERCHLRNFVTTGETEKKLMRGEQPLQNGKTGSSRSQCDNKSDNIYISCTNITTV
jgi:hypothetical protein